MGGGSGGHITPLLSLAHELKKIEPTTEVVYIGWRGDHGKDLSRRYRIFDRVHLIPAGKYRRYHGQSLINKITDFRTMALNIRDFFRVLAGTIVSYRLLGQIKPSVVFSKGSFVAVPVGITARLKKIPIITHDSDSVPGLANRIIGRWATLHAVGQAKGAYSYDKDKTHYVGVPVDERIKPVSVSLQRDYKRRLGIPIRAQLLLIVGGGLGAQSINRKVAAIMPRLLTYYPNLYVIHFSGSGHEEAVKESYRLDAADNKRLNVIGFSNEFHIYSGAADLIISRAGATAVAEFAIAGKALLLVPASHLAGGHQIANAKEIVKNDAAAMLGDEASANEYYRTVSELLDDQTKRQALASNLGRLAKPRVSQQLARLILDTAKSGG